MHDQVAVAVRDMHGHVRLCIVPPVNDDERVAVDDPAQRLVSMLERDEYAGHYVRCDTPSTHTVLQSLGTYTRDLITSRRASQVFGPPTDPYGLVNGPNRSQR